MTFSGALRSGLTQRRLAVLVACAAACGFFLYYGPNNDHFDRLARARQIAMYGDVPFRDFFDPGYFLTLYASAFLERLLGDNLLGEMLLNVGCMTAGTVLVFLLASRASGSPAWGLVAASMIVLAEPRTYDYDKILFYPLGLWACWRYADRPTVRNLLWLAAIIVLAGLFRYDTAVYLSAAAVVTLIVMHSSDWRFALSRVAVLAAAMLLLASPALVFVQRTAGLGDAFNQIATYAHREGERSRLFRLTDFDIDWSLPLIGPPQKSRIDSALWQNMIWLPGFMRDRNAEAWLHWLGLGVPLLTVSTLLARANRDRAAAARILSCAVLGGLVALFILREPVRARIGGVMPIILIGAAFAVERWRAGMTMSHPTRQGGFGRKTALALPALIVSGLTLASLWALLAYPPFKNIHVLRRLSDYAETPPKLDLIPGDAMGPLARYIQSCTQPTDRFFVPWFAGEVYFFSARGFAAGLPVVFGNHWSELQYQRRSTQILDHERVPIIVMKQDELTSSYPFIWKYVLQHYRLARVTSLGELGTLQIWVRQALPVTRFYGGALQLPCYGNGEGTVAAVTSDRN